LAQEIKNSPINNNFYDINDDDIPF